MGPGIQDIPEKFDFHDFSGPSFTNNMKMVDQHGWGLEFRTENDTK